MRTLGWGLFLLCLAAAARGQEDLQPEELTLATLATPNDAGELQVTARGGAERGRSGRDPRALVGGLDLELGLSDDLQLGLSLPWRGEESSAEWTGAPGLELLARLWRSDRVGLELSLGLELTLPLTSGGAERPAGEGTLAGAWRPPGQDRWTLFASLCLELEEDEDGGLAAGAGAALAVAWRLGRGWFALLEGELRQEDGALRARAGPGLRFHPRPWLELGVTAPLGLTPRDPDLAIECLLVFSGGSIHDDPGDADDDEHER